MVWTAPRVERDELPSAADEWTMLLGRLDRNRQTFLIKCAGLTGEQLARQEVPPSNLSLLGLIRHLTETERAWFRRLLRHEDAPRTIQAGPDFDDVDPARAEQEYGKLVAEIELCRQAVAGASLDAMVEHDDWGRVSLRFVFGHMIEEYARHNGHADLLRERIDGATG
jgi:uncharacterized damage-inducible protein DinB